MVDTTWRGTEQFNNLVKLLQRCPTCSKNLIGRNGNPSIRVCPDAYHGTFMIVWSQSDQRYHVSFTPKERSLS